MFYFASDCGKRTIMLRKSIDNVNEGDLEDDICKTAKKSTPKEIWKKVKWHEKSPLIKAAMILVCFSVCVLISCIIFTIIPTQERPKLASSTKPGIEWNVKPIRDDAYRATNIKSVAIFTEAYLPKVDGVSKLVSLVTKHHLNLGRDVMIVCPHLDMYGYTEDDFIPEIPLTVNNGERAPIVKVIGLNAIHLNPIVPYETAIGIPQFYNSEIEQFDADIVQLFSPAMLSWTGVWYANRRNIPIVANWQTDLPGYSSDYGIPFVESLLWWYLGSLHKHADVTTVPTHDQMRVLRTHGFPGLVKWDRAVDSVRFSSSKRSQEMRKRMLNGLPDDTTIILYVGRLAKEKYLHLLEGVVGEPNTYLVIVGDGTERTYYEEKFNEKAHFMGFITGEELAVMYASADIFCFTGVRETAGQVVREALSSGLPCLVPNSGGVTDYVLPGFNGLICEPNADSYRENLRAMLSSPEILPKMSSNAADWGAGRSWEKVMEELEIIYHNAENNKAKTLKSYNSINPDSWM